MKYLKEISDSWVNVSGLSYWKPDEIKVENPNVPYLGRSIFDEKGNSNKGIQAWQIELN